MPVLFTIMQLVLQLVWESVLSQVDGISVSRLAPPSGVFQEFWSAFWPGVLDRAPQGGRFYLIHVWKALAIRIFSL